MLNTTLAMHKFVNLIVCLIFSLKSLSQFQVTYSVQAHPDDWQLFMSSKIYNEVNSGGKVVFITLSAGDEGSGSGAYLSPIPYYVARERGSIYSSKYVADVNGGVISDTPSHVRVSINGKSIVKYSYNNNKIINYFLRLPDGNALGQGFGTIPKSLKKLFTGSISNISSVEGVTTYNSWVDLTATVRAIIIAEKGLDNQVWVNTASLDSTSFTPTLNNSNDHSDHYYTSRALQDAVSDLLWVGINEFINYKSFSLPANLTLSEHQNAAAIFGVYVWAMQESRYEGAFDAAHKSWLPIDYFSIKRNPVGNAPGAVSVGGLTEVPMIVAVTDPAYTTNDFKILMSLYQAGQVNTAIYDMAGNKLAEQNTDIQNREPIVISLNRPFKLPGTYLVKTILNNQFVDNRKITVL